MSLYIAHYFGTADAEHMREDGVSDYSTLDFCSFNTGTLLLDDQGGLEAVKRMVEDEISDGYLRPLTGLHWDEETNHGFNPITGVRVFVLHSDGEAKTAYLTLRPIAPIMSHGGPA